MKKLLLSFLLLVASCLPAVAQVLPAYPVILQNGTTAYASDVMSDFYAIQTAVNSGLAQSGANTNITQLLGLTTPLSVLQGGTGATTASVAASNLGALQIANNLSELVGSAGAANTNLGLGTANTPAFAGLGLFSASTAQTALELKNTSSGGFDWEVRSIGSANPDSTAVGALEFYNLTNGPVAWLTSGGVLTDTGEVDSGNLAVTGTTALTGAATGPTPAADNSTTKLATTAFVNPGHSAASATNGYYTLPGSIFTEEWGGGTTAGKTTTITFPQAFAHTALAVVASDGGTSPIAWAASTYTSTTFILTNNTSGGGAYSYIAIGY